MSGRKHGTQQPIDVDVSAEHYHLFASGRHFIVMRHSHVWSPPTDVVEHADCITVLVEVAGMRQDDFQVAVKDCHLIITGTRPSPHVPQSAYYQLEVQYGGFRTDVILPWAVDEANIEVTYQDGFLKIQLPRAQPHRVYGEDPNKPD